MVISPILKLGARIRAHPLQQKLLQAACADCRQWDDLLPIAEKHGISPLLHKHLSVLDADIPREVLRGLRFLSIRHQRENEHRIQGMQVVLDMLEREGIPSLVLKGAALSQTLYPQIGLRPMSDIDLFLEKKDAFRAHALLLEKGLSVATEELPEDYYHLPPLCIVISGFEVWIELHHGLFPELPPYYEQLSFVESWKNATCFKINGGMTAYRFADEEMLWHLFQHGFHAPLTYTACKLISAADIISLVEEKDEELDWEKIRGAYPQLFNALGLFHHITPWNEPLTKRLQCGDIAVPEGAGEAYRGWPLIAKKKEYPGRGVLQKLYDTLLPSSWWLRMYYGGGQQFSLLWCRMVHHPAHLLRWLKVYAKASL